MKQTIQLVIFLYGCLSIQVSHSQNIAVNTTGTAAAAANMFEVTQASTTNNTVGIFAKHSGAATNAYAIWAEATGATNKYAIIVPSGGGYVGIGTSNPTSELEVVSTVSTMPRGILSSEYSNGILSDAHLWLRKARGTEAAPTAILAGDEIGFIKFRGYGTSFSTSDQTEIGAVAAENFSGTANGSYLKFMTTPITTTTGAERMRIDQNGHVGIGTTTPSARLDVDYPGTVNTYAAKILHSGNAASPGTGLTVSNGYPTSSASGSYEIFGVYSNSFASNHVSVRDNGNVGIGTAGPGDKLEVNGGNIKITNGSAYNGMVYSGDANWGFKIQQTAATDDYNVRMSYYPSSGTRKAGIFNANANTWVLYADQNATPNIIMNDISSVGIGTSTPATRLNIVNTSTADPRGLTSDQFSTDAVSSQLNLRKSRGTPTAPSAIVNGDALGIIKFRGYDGSSFSDGMVRIESSASENWTTTAHGAGVSIMTTPNGSITALNRLHILNSGYVGIGTATPGGQFELSLDQGRKPSSNTWTITSDSRLKNIEGSYTKGLQEILQLQPITYYYKNSGERTFPEEVLKTLNVGYSAQEVQKIFPEAVGVDSDGYLNFNIHAILIAYTNAIKEQQKLIEELSKKVNALENKLNTSNNLPPNKNK